MKLCEFCEQYNLLPQLQGNHRFADGSISFCDITDLGTGISWRNIGKIRMDCIPINFCPKCGRDLKKEGADV